MSDFNFQESVIDQSYQKPVVVDFWAPWCGPCRFLGPVLDELAKAATDTWTLVKINTDEHQELSSAYDVRGIPAVKMFYKGKVKAEFVGALPKHQVERWLQTSLPNKNEETLEIIQEQLQHPDEHAHALAQLEQMALHFPDFLPAQLALAEQLVWTEPDRALQLLKPIGEFEQGGEKAADLRTFARLALFSPPDNQPPTTQDQTALQHLIAAQQAAKQADFDTAIANLINSVAANKNYLQGMAAKTAVAFFRNQGFEHPLSRKYRHKFDMLLY